MEQGITFIDTSENYGLEGRKASLSSEQIIGRCMEENTEAAPILATTMSNPWKSLAQGTGPRIGRVAILKAIEASCERTGTGCIDLYQVPPRMFYLEMNLYIYVFEFDDNTKEERIVAKNRHGGERMYLAEKIYSFCFLPYNKSVASTSKWRFGYYLELRN